ncbi:TetR/AcrR family transcriptional regulator [Ancylobacter sp. G4_0304]|uniref:TetR/AcrR family transcriptional regulator n=1 Tax=Ancylobacter novellus TaxID=921 RepID=A0A2W5QJP9_ANCNO|nr:MAG: TetR/AcrR family transcriptional regulator [Ancylobacter novellus]
MPKISDEKRVARRLQILEAAWTCFDAQGLHATTMSDIIRVSGLSAGAVYSYFPSKDELILSAVSTSLSGLSGRVEPIFSANPPPPPDLFIRQVCETIALFTVREGYDLRRLALLGWSEAQRNEKLRATMRGFYLAFRERLADLAARWQRDGMLGNDASTPDVAKTMLAIILGYVVQFGILGDVAPPDLARGLRDLAGQGQTDAA